MSTKQKEGVDFSEWKNLIQGFVGNVLERISDNVSQKIHAWIKG